MGILGKALKGTKALDIQIGREAGWHSISRSALSHYKGGHYENAYPSISKIANEFMTIEPYTLDVNGDKVESNVINRLYHPNQDMSAVDFREALAVMALVHKKVHILVWRKEGRDSLPGGTITPDNIGGFTFLEGAVETVADGKKTYTVNGRTFTDKEVITLKGINPYDLSAGFSATDSARRWTTLDDYIADFQSGFFENGAVPAGQFIVTARTTTEYNDMVDTLQARHRGAGNNNNVTYTHRPIDPNTSKPLEAQVEWTPFNSANKDLDLKNIFEQVNKKIDSAYGVPASIRGVNDSNTYASVRIDQEIFIRYAVKPFALKVWNKFTHELNRITGGLGVAISFDIEMPNVAEEDKLVAETKEVELRMIRDAVLAGYSLESAIEALGLSDSYKRLVNAQSDTAEDDEPDVDVGDEVNDSPDPSVIDPFKGTKLVTARDFSEELEKIVAEDTGYIMLDTEPLSVLSAIEDGQDDLVPQELTDFGNLPGEDVPHVTILDGVLNQPSEISKLAQGLYEDTPIKSVTIEDISYFDLEKSNAVIAKIELSDQLKTLRDNFDLVPHASKFSEYNPHLTIAYLKKEADVDKWIESLKSQLVGKEIKVTGLNLGSERDGSNGIKGGSESTDPKEQHGHKRITPEARQDYEEQLETVSRSFMQAQIDSAVRTTKAVGDPTEEQTDEFIAAFMAVVVSLMIAEGSLEYAAGVQILLSAGLTAPDAPDFILRQSTINSYREYLGNVAQSYGNDTAMTIRSVLDRANIEGFSRAETEAALRNIINTDDYRIKRLARSEVNRSQGIASNDSIQSIQEQTGVRFNKVWNTSRSDACEYCRALDGTVVDMEKAFVPLGDTVQGVDGGERVNDFVSMDTASGHANCTCYMTYEVAASSKAVTKEIHCSACDRFLGETTKSIMTDKLKCSNSSCKALEVPIIKEKENA